MSEKIYNWGGGTNYSTDEQIVGTWIDGKPIYQKTITFESAQRFSFDYSIGRGYLTIKNYLPTNFAFMIKVLVLSSTNKNCAVCTFTMQNDGTLYATDDIWYNTITFQYTKTTD